MVLPEPPTYEALELERLAREFLGQHFGSDIVIPIDVDLLVERVEGVDLDYWPGLRANHRIEGMIARDPKTGEYACLWLDNTGVSAFDPAGVGRGSVAGDSIPFLFRYTATDSFHTTFLYNRATDSWQWHMDNDSAGVRRPFARVTLTRR